MGCAFQKNSLDFLAFLVSIACSLVTCLLAPLRSCFALLLLAYLLAYLLARSLAVPILNNESIFILLACTLAPLLIVYIYTYARAFITCLLLV